MSASPQPPLDDPSNPGTGAKGEAPPAPGATPPPDPSQGLGDDVPWVPPPAWLRRESASVPGPAAPGQEGAAEEARAWPETPTTWQEAMARADAPVPTVPPWRRALDLLATDRRAQLMLAALVLAGVLAYSFWPRETPGVSLGALKRDPDRFAGRKVCVRGRVVDVFPLGGAAAFSLVQGRDTLTVFTRFRSPRRGERLQIVAAVHPGRLDGVTRVALFEEPPAN